MTREERERKDGCVWGSAFSQANKPVLKLLMLMLVGIGLKLYQIPIPVFYTSLGIFYALNIVLLWKTFD